ncbi:carbohydrate sulfotransferase 10-like [Macrobrachium nipponense]|uniref:carbohydrate sulfotransferase 10-like n=1 Tax=Macrobrachium nipponense TaxID=159736 RepID=UPI0030C83115
MVFPGIIRKLNKNLPALLQTIVIICLIHYMGQSVLLKFQKKLHLGRFSQVASSTHRPPTGGGGGSGGVPAWKSNARGPSKFGGGFSRSHGPSRSTSSTTTTTTTTPIPPFEDDIMREEQQRRLDILQETCTRWNLGLWAKGNNSNVTDEEKSALSTLPKNPLYQALLVSEKYHMAVCPVARAGIQWLSRRLLQLLGKFDERQLLHLQEPPSAIARHNFPYLSSWEKYPSVLSNSVTLLMARHPLDRLLASYRYLLEDPERNPHGYLHYGRRIVRSYRLAPGHGKAPTFEEFVRFLLARDMSHMEEAWQPAIRRCTPCHIPYNVITHYETLWHDVQWAWKKAGLGSLNTTDYVQYTMTPEIRRQYFSELTLAQVLQLYQKYKLDFDLYGYSLEEHMAYARPGDEAPDLKLMAIVPRKNTDNLQKLLSESKAKANYVSDDVIGERQAPAPAAVSSSVAAVIPNETVVDVNDNFIDNGEGDLFPQEK